MIRRKVADGKVAGADGTGVNVGGKNDWLWEFQNAVATYSLSTIAEGTASSMAASPRGSSAARFG